MRWGLEGGGRKWRDEGYPPSPWKVSFSSWILTPRPCNAPAAALSQRVSAPPAFWNKLERFSTLQGWTLPLQSLSW